MRHEREVYLVNGQFALVDLLGLAKLGLLSTVDCTYLYNAPLGSGKLVDHDICLLHRVEIRVSFRN